MDEQVTLTELPDDLLLRVLAGAGSKGILNSAAACKRFIAVKGALSSHTCFASAASQLPKLEDAVKDAAGRALEGMLGAVDFAVIFTANYPVNRQARGPPDASSVHSSNAANMLASFLPKGVRIIGCPAAGVMGVRADGTAFEVDPVQGAKRGVTVLLGCMPEAVVRVFADTQADPSMVPETPWAGIEQWAHLQQDGLVPVSAWLLFDNTRNAAKCVMGPGGVVEWIQQQAPPECPPAIAGGLASGRATPLLFHPGDQVGDEEVMRSWRSDPLAAIMNARYVGLMVCAKSAAAATHDANAAAVPAAAGTHDANAAAAAPAGTNDANAEAAAAAATHDVNAAGLSKASAASLPVFPVPLVSAPGGAEGPCSSLGPHAAVMSMHGMGAAVGSSWWGGLRLEEHPDFQEEGYYEFCLLDPANYIRLGGPQLAAPVQPEPQAGGPSSRRPRRASRPVLLAADFLSEALQAAKHQAEDLEDEQLSLALWRSDATPDCAQTGLTPDVLRSGLAVVGELEIMSATGKGLLRVVLEDKDRPTFESVLARGIEHVYCQLASVSPATVRQLLQRELPVMRDLCNAPQPNTRPDPRQWEGYALLRQSALAAGARSGPMALAVFSCTGRGSSIFGKGSVESEAAITDEVLHHEVPMIGVYCNGEIGPFVQHGYVGWSSAGASIMRLDPAAVNGEAAAAADGKAATGGGSLGRGTSSALENGPATSSSVAAITAGAGRRQLRQDPCMMQGMTSMYAALG